MRSAEHNQILELVRRVKLCELMQWVKEGKPRWFRGGAVRWFNLECLDGIYSMIKNGEMYIRNHPEQAGRVFNAAFKNLDGWDFGERRARDEEVRLSLCEHLAYLGTPYFVDHGEYYNFQNYRVTAYAVERHRNTDSHSLAGL